MSLPCRDGAVRAAGSAARALLRGAQSVEGVAERLPAGRARARVHAPSVRAQ